MNASTFEFEMPSDPKRLKDLSDFLLRSAQPFVSDRSDLDDILITADEIATNIILHAYRRRPDRRIHVRLDISPERAVISFRHTGDTFDPSKVRPPDLHLPLTERHTGGMGLYIINKLMDQVIYRFKQGPDDENVITVVKNLAHQGVRHAP